MNIIRSLIFSIYMYVGTAVIALFLLIILPFSKKEVKKGARAWAKYIMFGMRYIQGITYEIRGLDLLPEKGAVVACKHQSEWDTAIFIMIRVRTIYILKKELTKIPFYGWYVKACGHIAIDRSAGASALKQMVKDVKSSLERDRNIVIFPEGTRVETGKTVPFQPGIAAIYTQTKRPIYPVALNSGMTWGRKDLIKKPGKIIMEIMPPIEPGLKRAEFMEVLEKTINEKTAELEKEVS